jgi:hypothetical protein
LHETDWGWRNWNGNDFIYSSDKHFYHYGSTRKDLYIFSRNPCVYGVQGVLITEINVTIIDEYTGNVLTQMTIRQFAQSYGANVRNNIVGLQLSVDNISYSVTRQSTGMSAFPTYEVYVSTVSA